MLWPLWRDLAQANHLPPDRYVLRVLPSEELNAFACGGHLVVVTSFAVRASCRPRAGRRAGPRAQPPPRSAHGRPDDRALAVAPGRRAGPHRVLAAPRGDGGDERVRRRVDGVDAVRPARRRPAEGRVVPVLRRAAAADGLGNVVAHRAEFQADQRVVRMGYGRNLAAALRRVLALGGGRRAVGLAGPAGRRRIRRPAPASPASTPCCATPRPTSARPRPAGTPRWADRRRSGSALRR